MRGNRSEVRDWIDVIREVQRHPEGIVAGCDATGIRVGQYYYHRRRIQRGEEERPAFREIRVFPSSLSSEVEIRLRNGRSILLRGEISLSQLSPLLPIVEGE
jgi:hypothetical protein